MQIIKFEVTSRSDSPQWLIFGNRMVKNFNRPVNFGHFLEIFFDRPLGKNFWPSGYFLSEWLTRGSDCIPNNSVWNNSVFRIIQFGVRNDSWDFEFLGISFEFGHIYSSQGIVTKCIFYPYHLTDYSYASKRVPPGYISIKKSLLKSL